MRSEIEIVKAFEMSETAATTITTASTAANCASESKIWRSGVRPWYVSRELFAVQLPSSPRSEPMRPSSSSRLAYPVVEKYAVDVSVPEAVAAGSSGLT